ncbi:hypothetical protein BYT27DRAFT_7340075 [Phlegmacium glaucopus]|nr:hypothetical protein BYT27DRAFT_7340075 [Phlegmacium glaucopus]
MPVPTFLVADSLVALICISLSIFLYKNSSKSSRPQGYVLQNQVTHSRLLPAESAHAFTYPTLSILVSLNALEDYSLNIALGWIFGYGGIWGRLVGIRPDPYLTNSFGKVCTIRSKLEAILKDRNYSSPEEYFQDAWMMTMPSFLGFEGINPLTVYFCYGLHGLRLVILEINNTFGEKHVHVLEVNQKEDEIPSRGYDHQWTFGREFHVSPFNDRSGFYTVSVKSPSHPPTAAKIDLQTNFEYPRPAVRVHLYTASGENPSTKGVLKLTALLRPITATPLTSLSLLRALVQTPFALLMTMPRILYVAWTLHFRKRLDAFPRPEPLPAVKDWDPIPAQKPFKTGGGVKWLDEGIFERFSRHHVTKFLKKRAEEVGVEIILVAPDPSVPRLSFLSSHPTNDILTISYLSSRIFTILFTSPSAQHALLLGCDTEGIFRTSSRDLFQKVFSSNTQPMNPTWLQDLRSRQLPQLLSLPIPNSHFLDDNSFVGITQTAFVIYSLRFLDWLEKTVFRLSRARIVEGREPWRQWDRASAKFHNEDNPIKSNSLGSVRH